MNTMTGDITLNPFNVCAIVDQYAYILERCKIDIEAIRNGCSMRISRFKTIMADNAISDEDVELAVAIAQDEFEDFGNLEPIALMVELSIPVVLENEAIRSIITGNLRNSLPDRRGKRKAAAKPIMRLRDFVITFMVQEHHKKGHPVFHGGNPAQTKTACEIVSEHLPKVGIDPLSPDRIHKIWSANKDRRDDYLELVFMHT